MENNNSLGITSISKLPINNLSISTNEMNTQSNIQHLQQSHNPIQIQNTPQNVQMFNNNSLENNIQPNLNYNELITQLQKASINGATSLPSRDIPMLPNVINNDMEVKPNYIPQHEKMEDYIKNIQSSDDLINQNQNTENNIDNLDAFYNEFQLPFLIAILYFLFQLPVFKLYMKKIIPSFYGSDGNPNLYGYILNSSLFAMLFYILIKLINQITINI